ncbi:MAG: PEGA domain-containing protein [Gemmatimonadetes bacterium]|nr:PEGA domain-containing protein [Gemmatimonadota bacterium]
MTNPITGPRLLLPVLLFVLALGAWSCGGGGGTDPDPPTKGSIQVNSNVDGAAISLNGIPRGETTDAKLSGLEPGIYTVRVSLDGYAVSPEFIDVTVVAGETVTAAFSLLLLEAGMIHVETDVAGAAILIDGEVTGRFTPADITDIAPGTYQVDVVHAGYARAMQSVTVALDSTSDASFTLVEELAGKRVLIEHYSNYGCTPCLPAELALEAAVEDLDPATVTTIGVHLNFPVFGDPFWLDNQQQNDDRRDIYSVIALPQFRFDGERFDDVDNKAAMVSDVQTRAAASPPYQIAIVASPVGDSLIVAGSVRKTADIAGEERLVVAAIETGIDYDSPNGIDHFDDIVKRFFPGISGLTLDLAVGEMQTFRYALAISDPSVDGDIPLDDWVAENLHAVAFVQSGTGFTVYQAGTTR